MTSDLFTPESGIVIRSADEADADLISGLIHELALYEKAPEKCHLTPEKVRLRLFGPRPFAEALIAEYKGQPVGFALFFHNFSTWEAAPGLYLEDLFVRPESRRHGIGRLLLGRLAAIAVERGCARFEWAVLDWNKPALELYEKLGARPLSEWVLYRMDGDALEALGRAGMDSIAAAEKDAPSEVAVAPASKSLVVIHTDGGAQPNPGVGGWAAVLRSGGRAKEISGGELGSTNNRMELTAAIRALQALKRPSRVELHTDSEYLRGGITKWIFAWKRNHWRRGKKPTAPPVKNADLWKALDALCAVHDVDWKWLPGHAGFADNERCDALCAEAIEKLLRESTSSQRRAALDEEVRRQIREQAGQ